ncbi:unnamed protein product, partial [Musa textilis]
ENVIICVFFLQLPRQVGIGDLQSRMFIHSLLHPVLQKVNSIYRLLRRCIQLRRSLTMLIIHLRVQDQQQADQTFPTHPRR